MNETIERVKEFIREEAEEYYSSERNYNNCDITSGMKCFSCVSDIEEEIIQNLMEVNNNGTN